MLLWLWLSSGIPMLASINAKINPDPEVEWAHRFALKLIAKAGHPKSSVITNAFLPSGVFLSVYRTDIGGFAFGTNIILTTPDGGQIADFVTVEYSCEYGANFRDIRNWSVNKISWKSDMQAH